MSEVLIKMKMPKCCNECWALDDFGDYPMCNITHEQRGYNYNTRGERMPHCPLVPVPPHGDLIDRNALIAELKRQCREVFRIDAVSPDDFWIERNEAYNQRLWQTWCEGFYDYLGSRPTIVPAEEETCTKN